MSKMERADFNDRSVAGKTKKRDGRYWDWLPMELVVTCVGENGTKIVVESKDPAWLLMETAFNVARLECRSGAPYSLTVEVACRQETEIVHQVTTSETEWALMTEFMGALRDVLRMFVVRP